MPYAMRIARAGGPEVFKLRGATVITTTSTPEKAELAREAGAGHVLDYSEVPRRVRELTGGRAVDVVYDGIGKDTFEGSLDSLRVRRGRNTQGQHRCPLSPGTSRRRSRSDRVMGHHRQGHPAPLRSG
jgi:D-arabinose 1-dehydrogenase-like Zn-dependent alcohol dehydrogenase